MRQHQILIDSIETLQDLFLLLTSHFEGVSLLPFKNSKTSCQCSAQYFFINLIQPYLRLLQRSSLYEMKWYFVDKYGADNH